MSLLCCMANFFGSLSVRSKLWAIFVVMSGVTTLTIIVMLYTLYIYSQTVELLRFANSLEEHLVHEQHGMWQFLAGDDQGENNYNKSHQDIQSIGQSIEQKESEQYKIIKAVIVEEDKIASKILASPSGFFRLVKSSQEGFIEKNNKHIRRILGYIEAWTEPFSEKRAKAGRILENIRRERLTMEDFDPRSEGKDKQIEDFRKFNDTVVKELVELWLEEIDQGINRAKGELKNKLVVARKIVGQITSTTFPSVSAEEAGVLGIKENKTVLLGMDADNATKALSRSCEETVNEFEQEGNIPLWIRADINDVGDNVTPALTLGQIVSCQQGLRINAEDLFSWQIIFVKEIEPAFSVFHENVYEVNQKATGAVDYLSTWSRRFALVSLGFLFLTLFFLGFILSKVIIEPLTLLGQAASEIAKGNLNKKVKVRSYDEIGKLTEIFNLMTDKIRDSYENLERKIREKTATISEEKAKDEAILSNIGEGMVATDKDERIIFANKQAELLLRIVSSQIKGKRWSDVVKVADEKGNALKDNKSSLLQALKESKKVVASVYLSSGTKKFPAVITATPVVLLGQTIGAIAIFRDITKEKEIDTAKTEFVSLASHQLRTPLTAINWYTEILLKEEIGSINQKQKIYLNQVYKSAKRMIELVNSLLDVSRIELGKFHISVQPINLVEVAEAVFKDLKSLIDLKKINVGKVYEKNLPVIMTDPKLIRIILENLISNAVKYTPDRGKIRLEIARKGDFFLLKVSDNGYGIPEKARSKIFSKLFRADNIREIDTTGTGLGLYLVRAIVEKLGGRINFESRENVGTTFFVKLPLEVEKNKK